MSMPRVAEKLGLKTPHLPVSVSQTKSEAHFPVGIKTGEKGWESIIRANFAGMV